MSRALAAAVPVLLALALWAPPAATGVTAESYGAAPTGPMIS